MSKINNLPKATSNYGVLSSEAHAEELGVLVEQVRRLGYGILKSGFTRDEQLEISNAYESASKSYSLKYGVENLASKNEQHMIRAIFEYDPEILLKVANNNRLIKVVSELINGMFILNQQNGVTNPPNEQYSQGRWHRDLPYQHFTSSSPLAVNALYCVDDFTAENGATYVVPATHKEKDFPSEEFINSNAIQIEAPAGSYLVLDCMIFHSGGQNQTQYYRRGINHVYNIPYFKQQISIPALLGDQKLSPGLQKLLGFEYSEPQSVEQFLERKKQV